MKLHDLRPADGSRQPRTRVGRGIAAGKGKTAGRGTKGQKARAGGSIPPWFEGGQTPLHMRIPKLRGFKNRFRIEYEVVNVGAIGALAERGAFEIEATGGKSAKAAPITVNQDILRAVGLVRTLNKPLKILGSGELTVPLFVVADAFTASARAKIEGAGGSVNVLEIPSSPLAALGVGGDDHDHAADKPTRDAPTKAPAKRTATADDAVGHADEARDADEARNAGEAAATAPPDEAAPTTPAAMPSKGRAAAAKAAATPDAVATEAASDEAATAADPADATDVPTATATDETDDVETAAPDPEADDAPSAAEPAETPSGDDA